MKKMLFLFISIIINLSCQQAPNKEQNPDYKNGKYDASKKGQEHTYNTPYNVKSLDLKDFPNKKVKNIILLIGDGMGLNQVYAGLAANRGKLNLFNFKNIGLSMTYSASSGITDSGAGGTAIACGQKTFNHAIGVDVNKDSIPSILEFAEMNGLSTGLISTSKITHATPASFIAHNTERKNYQEIAEDFLNVDFEIIIGGGKDDFNKRKDGQNLIEEFKSRKYAICDTKEELFNSDANKVVALLTPGHMPKFSERGEILAPATKKAIEVLSKNKKGFFLMVEGSQIDWAGHDNDIGYLVNELLDFDRAIGEALKFALTNEETLVIVTADHETGAFTCLNSNLKTGWVEGKFSSKNHTPIFVPVFSYGPYSKEFKGIFENTAIFHKMLKAYSFK